MSGYTSTPVPPACGEHAGSAGARQVEQLRDVPIDRTEDRAPGMGLEPRPVDTTGSVTRVKGAVDVPDRPEDEAGETCESEGREPTGGLRDHDEDRNQRQKDRAEELRSQGETGGQPERDQLAFLRAE